MTKETRKTSDSAVPFSRRKLLSATSLSCLALTTHPYFSSLSLAQEPPLQLPLPLTTLAHHIGISVRDVLKSAEFYSRVFGGSNVNGEQEPSLRYFIYFKPTDMGVDAGDVAIGLLGTAGSVGKTEPLIDHLAIGAVPHKSAPWRAALRAQGVTALDGGGIMFDNDGIPLQVAGALDESMSEGEVVKMPSLYSGAPLVKSTGFDHVLLRVSDLDASAAFYHKIFGLEADRSEPGMLWFSDGKVRLGMRALTADETPGVDTYAVRVEPFDAAKVREGLVALGGSVEARRTGEPEQLVRFADIDGIKAILTAD